MSLVLSSSPAQLRERDERAVEDLRLHLESAQLGGQGGTPSGGKSIFGGPLVRK